MFSLLSWRLEFFLLPDYCWLLKGIRNFFLGQLRVALIVGFQEENVNLVMCDERVDGLVQWDGG